MFVDSHCHLNFPELYNYLDIYLNEMKQNKVDYALCVGTRPENLDPIVKLANQKPNIFASVGIHPDEKLENFEFNSEFLLKYVNNPKVVAIGETGLDYYSIKEDDMSWQHQRFVTHIEVAKISNLPLIIHTRESVADTINMLHENGASKVGGVMHCFTETLEYAKKCLDLGFYISISGIVTFKNAGVVKEVAKYVPLDRLLIETDSPFLAPVPYRGKLNHPALVIHTAGTIAELKSVDVYQIAEATTGNFFNLFKKAKKLN